MAKGDTGQKMETPRDVFAWAGIFSDSAQEEAYLKETWPDVIGRVRLIFGMTALLLAVEIIIIPLAVGLTEGAVPVLSAHSAALLASLIPCFAFSGSQKRRYLYGSIILAEIAVYTLIFILWGVWLSNILLGVLAIILTVLVFHVFTPAWLSLTIGVNFICSTFITWQLATLANLTDRQAVVIIVMIAAINIIAANFAMVRNRMRRQAFLDSEESNRYQARVDEEARERRRSDDLLSSALQSMDEGFAVFDADDQLIIANTKYREIFWEIWDLIIPGTAFKEMLEAGVERGLFVVEGMDHDEWVAERMAYHLSARGVTKGVIQQELWDNRWVQIADRQALNGTIVSVCTDITELKSAERELAQSQQITKTLLEASDTYAELFTIDGQRLAFNQWVQQTIGGSHEEVMAINVLDSHDPEYREFLTKVIAQISETRSPYRTEYQANGRWYRISYHPILNDLGEVHQISLHSWDITDQRREEERLRRAKDSADAANRSKSEFLANMSHELRTPLNAIIGFSETISRELMGPIGNERYRAYAEDIQQSGLHLLSLINDVLDLSKIEAGRLELNEEPVKLKALTNAAYQLVRQRAETKGVELSLSVPSLPIEIFADQRAMKQVLINLLDNAVKYTDEGGTVSIVASADRGGLEIRITDTGSGMAEEDIPTALKPFSQVGEIYGVAKEGTGLGLSIAVKLLEMHGGTLDIESEPGQGTCITVRLPANRLVGDYFYNQASS